ncbi:sensor histidine kinase [Cellulophaga baltica]|uniref:sensor histidine kinase n=1 Tax=Cellulophaga baltica TaxID=76594 RepID=UPI0004111DEC|nr:HAMP domain-containing sensor histidine kinase [Cellulophaga baltica]MBA6313271.1 HAMP domain-containing histidine kinase [Cellulophaga baltica]
MRKINTNWLIYIIALTIAITILIQLFWNYDNYKSNKQRYQNDVQIALDNSVDAYFSEIGETDLITVLDIDNDTTYTSDRASRLIDQFPKLKIAITSENGSQDSTALGIISSFKDQVEFPRTKIIKGRQALENFGDLQNHKNIISFTISRDSLDLKQIDFILKKELLRKNISIQYQLQELKNDTVIDVYPKNNLIFPLYTESTSTLFKPKQKLFLHFEDSTLIILKKGVTSIFISLILSILIISCLIYMLYIINRQKKIAQIKNDLISNITHEFKTPIATATIALEGIRNFNTNNDPKKSNEYLDISNRQLQKLNSMVEKLLETAALDSDKLLIKKEEIEVNSLLDNILSKYKILTKDKIIHFIPTNKETIIMVDHFHFENVINNLIDNALKYGGDRIEITICKKKDSIKIMISDNGVGISKNQTDKIFEKFYRIPTGNIHDVKGSGIGLFYSKKIIEKHGGKLTLDSKPNKTIFTITICTTK